MYEVHVGTRSGTVGKLRARTLGMHGLEPLACMDVMDGLCEVVVGDNEHSPTPMSSCPTVLPPTTVRGGARRASCGCSQWTAAQLVGKRLSLAGYRSQITDTCTTLSI